MERKKIKVKGNYFTNCDSGIKIKGMSKRIGVMEELDILVQNNEFSALQDFSLALEKVVAGTIQISNNKVSQSESIGMMLTESKAVKEDIFLSQNVFSGVRQVSVLIETSVVSLISNQFISSATGIYVSLQTLAAPQSPHMKDEIFDSHRDIYLRESYKESFMLGASNTHFLGNYSILGDTMQPHNHQHQLQHPCRVIIKENKFREMSITGVFIKNNSAGSIKVQDCVFFNAKDPVVVQESTDQLSRDMTRNLLGQENSEIGGPSFVGSPRVSIKGTIVVKNNRFDGSKTCLLRKKVSSYVYEIGNKPMDQ